MNISSETFTTDGYNFSEYFISNSTEEESEFVATAVNTIIILLGFPINSYVIWLIVTRTGNGLAAEFFSLNLAVCEMLYCMECVFYLIDCMDENLRVASRFLYGLSLTGRSLFQCLICVERYLAVVHPVTFLKYKPLRYRVICCVTIWVASFAAGGINVIAMFWDLPYFQYIFFTVYFFLIFSIQLFLLVSVLRVLKQAKPGERGRERKEENHMKKRAFYIILITTGTILIIFFPYIILNSVSILGYNEHIFLTINYFCFFLGGLVHPFLFLSRVGKMPS